MTVVASGFFMSLPSFAKSLVKLTPALAVMPSSFFMSALKASAIFLPSPKSPTVSVQSSQHSSGPNGSTQYEYLLHMPNIRLDTLSYTSKRGGTNTIPGAFAEASDTVSPVFTPSFFAISFFARTTPCRFSGDPATATGLSAMDGFTRHSTLA